MYISNRYKLILYGQIYKIKAYTNIKNIYNCINVYLCMHVFVYMYVYIIYVSMYKIKTWSSIKWINATDIYFDIDLIKVTTFGKII